MVYNICNVPGLCLYKNSIIHPHLITNQAQPVNHSPFNRHPYSIRQRSVLEPRNLTSETADDILDAAGDGLATGLGGDVVDTVHQSSDVEGLELASLNGMLVS
jgi:hypothetical protein